MQRHARKFLIQIICRYFGDISHRILRQDLVTQNVVI